MVLPGILTLIWRATLSLLFSLLFSLASGMWRRIIGIV